MSSQVELLASALRSCKSLPDGKTLAAEIESGTHHHSLYLKNLVLELYTRLGSLEESEQVFRKINSPNLHSWNILLTAYTRKGHLLDARALFDGMPSRDQVSWTIILRAYIEHGDLREANAIFERMPRRDQVAWNVLLAGLAQEGDLQRVIQHFQSMPQRDTVSWNTLTTAYAENGHLVLAKETFDSMPNRDVVSWNIMIASYSQHGCLQSAINLFQRMAKPNVISWTIVVSAYAQKGHMDKAEALFKRMPKPNVFTWTVMVWGYAKSKRVDEARKWFDRMPERNIYSWTVMLAAYAEKGDIQVAKSLFDGMQERNVISWTVMIAGYARQGNGREAIRLFKLMDLEGVQADKAALVAPLAVGDLGLGELVAASVDGFQDRFGIHKRLVNVYGKCGSLESAKASFLKVENPDTVTYNTLIASYAVNGHSNEAIQMYWSMSLEGVSPDALTFICLLCACSRKGKLEEGREHFVSISADYGMCRVMDHYQCMVDVLGRVGWLDYAEELIESMPFVPDFLTWMTLLSACNSHGHLDRGVVVAERAFKLEPENPVPYVILSSLYSQHKENSDLKRLVRRSKIK